MNKKGLKILIINLREEASTLEERKDLLPYMGGVALGTQLLKEHCVFDGDPLDENQPIIFTRGPLNTVFPVVTKVCAMFKSPLTGELGESYAGLRMGLAMMMADLDGIVIKGKCVKPSLIHINNSHIKVKSAKPLWGLDVDETLRLLHDQEGKRGLRSIIAIGPAGEKGIAFSCATVDLFRHFGRLGLGCVLGSKNIKAIVIEGDVNQPIQERKEYRKVYEKIYKKVTETDLMEKYHGLGTSININVLNDMKALPTYNFQQSSFEKAKAISGESFAENHLIKKVACSGCPIGCIHVALLRKKFDDPHEYASTTVSYDHELIYALGSLLGIEDREGVLRLIEKVELYGIDAISTGVLLAWLTEAYEKKLISIEETLVEPRFGEVTSYEKMIDYLVSGENELYRIAAGGTDEVASKYKGKDFAMVLGKTEVAGYHTGYGNIIGQAVGARHSHLDNGGYAIDQEMEKYDPQKIVAKLIEEEVDRNLLNSLVICLFARKIYDDDTVVEALGAMGYAMDIKQLKNLGLVTLLEKQRIKEKMGFDLKKLQFPKRFFETPSCGNQLDEDKAGELLAVYIEKMNSLQESYDKRHISLFAQEQSNKSLV